MLQDEYKRYTAKMLKECCKDRLRLRSGLDFGKMYYSGDFASLWSETKNFKGLKQTYKPKFNLNISSSSSSNPILLLNLTVFKNIYKNRI